MFTCDILLPTGGWQCGYDFVTVSQETPVPGMSWRRRWRRPSWGPYCGKDLPSNLTTRGTTIVTFHSDFVIERPGFVIKYTIRGVSIGLFLMIYYVSIVYTCIPVYWWTSMPPLNWSILDYWLLDFLICSICSFYVSGLQIVVGTWLLQER